MRNQYQTITNQSDLEPTGRSQTTRKEKSSMFTKKEGGVKRLFAVLIASVFAITAYVLAPASAVAPAPTPGNIDTGKSGSISVHKYDNGEWDQAGNGDGSVISEIPGTVNPIGGVEFKLKKLDLDLIGNTNNDWGKVPSLKAKADCTGAVYEGVNGPVDVLLDSDAGVKTATTDDTNGLATFAELPVAAYLVCEGDSVPANIAKKAAPFIVILPMPGDSEWNYDVHVYPKNEITDASKTLQDDAQQLGDKISWLIKVKIPTLDDGETLKGLTITDELDPAVKFVGVEDVQIGDDPENPLLVKGTHYTVVQDTENEQKITVSLTDEGKLVAQAKENQGKYFQMVLVAKVTSLPEGGTISNTAVVNVHDGEVTVTTDGDDNLSKWGELQILKQDADNQKALAGAKFAVYKKTSTGDTCVDDDMIADNKLNDDIVTGDDGMGTLVVKTGKAAADKWYGEFCLKEVEAPAGYVLSDTPLYVKVFQGEPESVSITIENSKSSYPTLPVTGAQGQVILIIGGVSLLALAVAMGTYAARRRNA